MTSPSRLTVFVSSTVRDFGPVRRDLKAWLESHAINARLSEHNDFPVARGVHSHDACLAAIAGCNLYVLLVGDRYGGRYKGTPKSITWREYDEAYEHQIPMVALVLKSTNDQTMELANAGARGEQEVTEALSRLLALAASARRELFKFEPGEVWNLMLYKKENDLLVPWVRHCDRRIERQERRWKLDEGHVGLAVSAR